MRPPIWRRPPRSASTTNGGKTSARLPASARGGSWNRRRDRWTPGQEVAQPLGRRAEAAAARAERSPLYRALERDARQRTRGVGTVVAEVDRHDQPRVREGRIAA